MNADATTEVAKVLEVRSLSAGYGGMEVLRDVALSVDSGEVVALVGGSGAGKTTLARCLSGAHAPSQGEVLIKGNISVLPQDAAATMNPRMRAQEVIAEPLAMTGADRHTIDARSREVCLSTGVAGDLLPRLPHQLSGGEARRVGIARALITRPSLLLLDEPLSSLDLPAQLATLELIRRLSNENGLAIFVISHDIVAVAGYCDRLIVMDGGAIVESGPPQELLKAPSHPATVALLAAVPGRLRGFVSGKR